MHWADREPMMQRTDEEDTNAGFPSRSGAACNHSGTTCNAGLGNNFWCPSGSKERERDTSKRTHVGSAEEAQRLVTL
jgi:hypothetical protein